MSRAGRELFLPILQFIVSAAPYAMDIWAVLPPAASSLKCRPTRFPKRP